ncbi:MAG TPA: DUF4340 domain-containing protein [Candidatus Merdisoma merdipullorum]|nr:DUF4340 domain-containing protein [Candidatus Merdisoma merdipullorum]
MTKKKKRMRMIAAVLILAALAVIYVLVLRADFNAEKPEEEEEITALTIDRADIRYAQIENSYGTLRFAYDGETWTSEDAPSFGLNQDSMDALFNRLNPLTAARDLGEEEETEGLAAYGLEDPSVVITVTLEEGQEYTIRLGAEASDGSLYFMTSESDHIYTGDSYLATAFDFELSDMEAIEEETDTEEEDGTEETVSE